MKIKKGIYTIRMDGRDYDVKAKSIKRKDGFVIIEHTEGDIEMLKEENVYLIVRYANKNHESNINRNNRF